MTGFIMVIVLLALYFLPSINARIQKHPNTQAITLLNLFLGWTLLGWVGALVWSAIKSNTDNTDTL